MVEQGFAQVYPDEEGLATRTPRLLDALFSAPQGRDNNLFSLRPGHTGRDDLSEVLLPGLRSRSSRRVDLHDGPQPLGQ